MRGQDLNLRPSGYEPDELPGCSTPREVLIVWLDDGWVNEAIIACSDHRVMGEGYGPFVWVLKWYVLLELHGMSRLSFAGLATTYSPRS